ncbi:hypothetical protein PRIPAC_80847, partial [Pristionchus pacificus]|uniref:Uncharacterized protein n=1 Tax=Pristionchus pacificus TaxID=54126 RepID=A0A2A6C2H8_PRIPA
ILLTCIDFYNCFLNQFYSLVPLPIFLCTGFLKFLCCCCNNSVSIYHATNSSVNAPSGKSIQNFNQKVVWAHEISSNFLALGEAVGDIGEYINESSKLKTHQGQIRFVYLLSMQIEFAIIFFVAHSRYDICYLVCLSGALELATDTWSDSSIHCFDMRQMVLYYHTKSLDVLLSFSPFALFYFSDKKSVDTQDKTTIQTLEKMIRSHFNQAQATTTVTVF